MGRCQAYKRVMLVMVYSTHPRTLRPWVSPTPVIGPMAPPPPPESDHAIADPVRQTAFRLGLVLIFLRFSMLHQTLAHIIHIDLHLLYVVGIPVLIGVLAAGGIQRAFRCRPTYYWVGFALWLVISLPFSAWKGGSAHWIAGYFRAEFIMLFVTGGLAITWRECKLMMYAISWGGAISLLTSKLFEQDSGGRVGLDFGTVNNPNDFACHLLLLLPFLLWIILASRSYILRFASLAGVSFGVYLILASGSRGAALGFAAATVCYLLLGTPRQRITVLVAAPILLAILLPVLPQRSWNRLQSLWSNDNATAEDTAASSESRKYLFDTGVRFAIEHPVFGIGQGQFANYEGKHGTVVGGIRGQYQEAHNTYLAAASECGMPALLLYLAGILSTFRLLNAVYRQARRRPECHDIRVATFCIMVALTGFCMAITFTNFTYFFYLPAMAGLAVSVFSAAQVEFRSRGGSVPPHDGSGPYH